MNAIEVELVTAPTDELRALIDELDRALAPHYLSEQKHGLTFEGLFAPHVRFFIARQDAVAVGCGGVALLEGFAEVKRMFVRENARGRGVAQAILRRIEREAADSGRTLLRLETGNRQFAAMRLYERAGFRACAAFGVYTSMTPQAIATSVFLEKRLTADAPPMRILVVGAGAVGGYFGGRLTQAERDVTLLVRPRRAEQIRRDALRIVSPYGDAVVHPRLVTAAAIAAPYDLILLGVKAYSLEGAMDDIAPAVGPETTIVPLLNGLSHIERLTQRFGERAVLGGVCMVSTDLAEDGTIVQFVKIHSIYYGERAGGVSARVRAVERVFAGAGFDSRASANIVLEMWEKWIQLASLGAVTCLLRGNIGEIARTPGGASLSLQIIDECNAIAEASGYPARAEILARVRENLTAPGSQLTSSMYRDLGRGGVTEADQILGNLLERGRAAGVPAPLVEAAFTSLTIYHSRLRTAAAV